jgi:nitroimidazol reductase NimA-like FMN-containing flavoprotein (pyridoxamine 5'-phosphate oxidase superfamily)
MTLLSPTARTQVRRHANRARVDRSELFEVLHTALICHLGVIMDGHPVILPTVFGVDPQGPDDGGSLYLHGSVASRSLLAAHEQDICVTCTHIDGLVLARSAFHHSMNYRSAVVIGRGRIVDDPDEKRHALDLVVDHVVPGRSATLRGHSNKELAATSVIALPLYEASVKKREGDPVDDQADIDSGTWAGVLPIAVKASALVTAMDAVGVPAPRDVQARAQALG